MRRVGKILVLAGFALAVVGATGWGALALYIAGPGGAPLRTSLATAQALAGLVTVGALFHQRWRWPAAIGLAVELALLGGWWNTIKPSNDRKWQPEVAVLPYATIQGDQGVPFLLTPEFCTEVDRALIQWGPEPSLGTGAIGRVIPRCRVATFVVLVSAGIFAAPLATGQVKGGPQETFPTPEAAGNALAAAYQHGDGRAVAGVLGAKAFRLVFSGDPVIDRHERAWFLSLYNEAHEVVAGGESRGVLTLGKDEVPYPIPIVTKDARWRFDSSEGHEDLLSRRMSKTELSTLNVVLAYVEAQREYHQRDRTGGGVVEYAQKLRSTPGQRDGLVWEGQPGKEAGPLAGLVEAASKEGYRPAEEGAWPVYRGYVYKILTAQGPRASGGARQYIVNGRMTEGFALVAFPVRYGVSGVMTFLVNQDGVVYQKDLGAKTVELGRKMTHFDPDPTWTKGQAN